MFNRSTWVELVLDASPWGLGGVLVIDGIPIEYFSSPLTADDERNLRLTIGSCNGQQTVEALVVLVAFRVWTRHFANERCILQVKSDSISALYMVANMTSKGIGSKIIARELALSIAKCSFRPDFVTHIPGVTNLVADELSRQHEPGHTFTLPAFVANALSCTAPARDIAFYDTLKKVPDSLTTVAAERSSSSSGCG